MPDPPPPDTRNPAAPTWRRMLDVLLPPTQLSGAEAVARTDWIPDPPGHYCPRCGATAAREAITITGCPHCRGHRIAWHGIWRLGPYKPPLSKWIVAYKFHRAWAWGPWFGSQLAMRTPFSPRTLVVPVPLHWRRRALRGYDQALLIAHAFAAAKQLPVARLLRRRRATKPQTALHNHEKRLRNVRGAFSIQPIDLTGWSVWLIDDVKTTGSTARACTHLLRRAGAEQIYIAAAAVADPKHTDFQRN